MAEIEIRDLLDNETGKPVFPRTHVDAVIGLSDISFFEAVQDELDPTKLSVRLKPEYTGLWAEGWISAGGVGTGGSGGGGLINTVYTWSELQTMATAPDDDTSSAVNARGVYEIWQVVRALQNSTPNVSLVNGSGSSTITVNSVSAEFYTKGQVDNLIGGLVNFHYEFAASTSAVTNPQSNVLYLIGPTGSGADKYEEYVYTDSTWKKIGDTSIDVSQFVTALGTSGNHLTWTKNGVANDLTVPFATKASQDVDGNTISSTYLKLSGGTVTGQVTFGEYIKGPSDIWFIGDDGVAEFASLTVNGASVLTSHQTVTNAGATLTPGQTITVATIGSTNITVQVPFFAMQQDIGTLNSYFTNGSANNALKLENHAASYFATATSVTDLTTRVTSLESMFEIVDGNVHVKNSMGLWSDSFISSGGVGTSGGGGGYGVEEITSNQDGTVDFHFTGGDITTVDLNHTHDGLLPDVDSSNNGKIMKVVNGEWALADESGGGGGGSGYEVTSNKVTSVSPSSTDTQYPSAKCVYDIVGDVETLLAAL